MSRSHLLASLFLVLGMADLMLVNVWLVPATWPPSSEPILATTTPAVLERTLEVEAMAVEGHTAERVAQDESGGESADGTETPWVAGITSRQANAEVMLEEPNETSSEPTGGRLASTAEAVEPQQLAEVVADLSDTLMEPEEKVEPVSEHASNEPLAEATEPIEPRQVDEVASDLSDAEGEPEEGVENTVEQERGRPLAEAEEAVEPQRDAEAIADSADAAADTQKGVESSTGTQARITTTAVEPIPESRSSQKTSQPSAEPQYRILHHAMVRFVFDGDTLRSASRNVLVETARVYRENPDAEIQVDGHTDNRGSEDYNYRLSERRARAVAILLEAEGIPSGRIQIRGHGPSQPLDIQNNAAARAKNRRVEITIRSRLP